MDDRSEVALGWCRVLGVLAAMVSGAYLLFVLSLGALVVTADLSGFGCFDGAELACDAR